MAIGERIHYFRVKRGITQKQLGLGLGFPERSADVRVAQYESGTRTPKADLMAALAYGLDVAPEALNVPDIDSLIGLMHTLFTLEDVYGLTVEEADGEVCLRFGRAPDNKTPADLLTAVREWRRQAARLEAGEITREEYDRFRHYFPKFDTSQHWVHVPSPRLSAALTAAFLDRLKDK